jgi:hypothetical protein
MANNEFFYMIIQAIVFSVPVASIFIYFGRKLQRVDQIEKAIESHLKEAVNREHLRRVELDKVYEKLNVISEIQNYIKGKLEGAKLW